MIWRGYNDFTYFTCQRCERKQPLEQMEWDSGLLVCTMYCGGRDKMIRGALEMAWAREASQDRRELVPDQKLLNPRDVWDQLNQISASAGSFD
jgi:hypothetical protein